MKKVVKLTESDLTRLVKRVIKEEETEINQEAKKRFDKLSDNVSTGFCVPVFNEGGKIRIECKDDHYWELIERRKFGKD